MTKSKKIGISLVGLLAVSGLCSPVISMFYSESLIKNAIGDASKQGNIKVELVSYERGLFGSTAKTKIELPNPQGQSADKDLKDVEVPSIVFVHHISHGPFAKNWQQRGLTLAFVDTQLESKEFSSMLPTEMATDLTWTGKIRTQVKMDNWTFQSLSAGVGVKATDIDFIGSFAPFSDHVDYQLKMPSITLNDPVYDVEFKGIDIDARFKLLGKIAVGKSAYNIEEVNLKVKNPESVSNADTKAFGDETSVQLSGLKATYELQSKKDTVEFTFDGKLGQMIAKGITYGPGELNFQISQLNTAVLQEISELMTDNKMDLQSKQIQMAQLTQKIILAKPKFVLNNFDYDTGEGLVNAKGFIDFEKDANISFTDPVAFSKAIHLELNLLMPQTIIENSLNDYLVSLKIREHFNAAQAQNKPVTAKEIDDLRVVLNAKAQESLKANLDVLVDKKVLTKTDKGFVIDYKYKDGELLVNGTKSSTPELFAIVTSLKI